MLRCSNFFRFLLSVFVLAGVIQAQSVTATINGTVQDAAGAVIPDATVTATNQGNSVSTTAKSNANGGFSFTGLTSGTYTVTITKAGFGTWSEKDIFLGPTVVRPVNASLTVGQVSTQITVEASAAQVQTETSQVSNAVAQEQVETLPLNGRNYQSLSALMPGVVNVNTGSAQGQGGFNTGNSMSINGMGLSGTLYELDGVWNMNTGNMTQTTILPNPDSIQEVRTLQNNYSPKYSLLGSSIVTVATRSGTKDFHGSVWEYFRNTDLDARNFFSPTVLAEQQNIYGGTIGGPLMIPKLYNKNRDKTFFFFSFQGTDRHVGSVQQGATATADNRNGLFSPAELAVIHSNTPTPLIDPTTGKAFSQNSAGQYMIPASRIVPQSLALYNALANLPNTSALGFNNYINTSPEVVTQPDIQIKIDQIVNSKTRLMGEYFDTRQTDNLPAEEWLGSPFTNNKQSFQTRSKLAELQMTTVISSSMVNQISIGMNNYVVDLNTTGLVYDNQVSGWETTLPYTGALSNRLPDIGFSDGFSSIGVTQTQPLIHASDLEDTLTDDWSWVKGKHFIEAGYNLVFSTKRQNKFAQSNGTWAFSGTFTNDPIADYLLGTAASLYQESTERRPYIHGIMSSPYVQDTWKVTPHFTVNYGVRLEYMPLPHTQNAWETAFDANTFNAAQAPLVNVGGTITPTNGFNPLNGIITNGVGGIPNNFTNAHKWYVGPNAGFAWDVFKDGKTSLRGGYGITYARVFTGLDCTYSCANNYPIVQNITLQAPSFPNAVGTGQAAQAGAPSIATVDLNGKAASVYTYSLSLEHQFGNWFVSVAGAGDVARSLPISYDLNQPFPTGPYNFNPLINYNPTIKTGTFEYYYGPYQGYGNISDTRSNGNSYWDALMLSVRHQIGHGLFITGAYTYSHTLSQAPGTSIFGGGNNPQNSYDLNGNYGNSPLDLRSLASFSYIYNIPWMQHATGWHHAVLGGWKYSGIISAQSGFALSPGLSVSNQGLATRPNISGAITYPGTVANWFSTSSFSAPAAGYFGNAGVGIIRGPGLVNFDMGFYKDFNFTEHQKLEFRGELFNIFNHTNFNGVSTTYGSGNFGQLTSALDPRIIEFSLRYHF